MSKTESSTLISICPSRGKCGEERDVQRIMEKFKDFYENKLNEIDAVGNGDTLEMKLKIQQRWIEDLTEQTQMMARFVRELEDEATNRVQMLEDKLKQTSKSAYEVMKRYQSYSIENNLNEPFQKIFYLESDLKNILEFIRRARDESKWDIDGLQFYDITYKDLFGREQCKCDDDDVDKEIAVDSSSCVCSEAIPDNKENILDVDSRDRNDLLQDQLNKKIKEYGILKQTMLDMRSALTEEVACKHDMISALKKDVQQLEDRCVQADKQTAFKDDIIKELRKEIKNLKKDNKELEVALTKQLDETRKKMCTIRPCDIKSIKEEKELEEEINRRQYELDDLRCRCNELDKALKNSQDRAENLQNAVDLYLNSVNVLQASEEKARIEIEQQRTTIANLQEALVNVKQELDECRQTSQQEVEQKQYLGDILYVNVIDLEGKNEKLNERISQLCDAYKKLQESTFSLEVEHFNHLQDMSILETQLHRYQSELKHVEDLKRTAEIQVKKLTHQNDCYERIVESFKTKIAVMSGQLNHLQHIINMLRTSSRVDNDEVNASLGELQRVCEKLHNNFMYTEKKCLVENYKNQLKDARIDELQLIIAQKNANLNTHDDAISNIRVELEKTYSKNCELQQTVDYLTRDLMAYKQNSKERSSCMNDQLSKQFELLQVEYNNQYQIIKQMQQNALQTNEEERRKKHNIIKQQKEKIVFYEVQNQQLLQELSRSRRKRDTFTEQHFAKEEQLVQTKQIVTKLRQTLSTLNQNGDIQPLTNKNDDEPKTAEENQEEQDGVLSFDNEIALFVKLVENLQDELNATKKKLSDVEKQNTVLENKLDNKDTQVSDLEAVLKQQQEDASKCVNELKNKLKQSQIEEQRFSEFLIALKMEVHNKIQPQQSVRLIHNRNINPKTGLCECDDCTDMNSAQDEITEFKTEIKNMVQTQLDLNCEKEKLAKEVTGLKKIVTGLEEKHTNVQQNSHKLQEENKRSEEKSLMLERENTMLVQTIKSLEMEIEDVKNNRDDICAESKCVMDNVRGWLEEQRIINEKVRKKTQCYCNTIKDLKEQNENMQSYLMPARLRRERSRKKTVDVCRKSRPLLHHSPDYQNVWSLGSQGSVSISPSRDDSPTSFQSSFDGGYSPNFRDDEETTDDEFLNKLETMTEKMRANNRKLAPNVFDNFGAEKCHKFV